MTRQHREEEPVLQDDNRGDPVGDYNYAAKAGTGAVEERVDAMLSHEVGQDALAAREPQLRENTSSLQPMAGIDAATSAVQTQNPESSFPAVIGKEPVGVRPTPEMVKQYLLQKHEEMLRVKGRPRGWKTKHTVLTLLVILWLLQYLYRKYLASGASRSTYHIKILQVAERAARLAVGLVKAAVEFVRQIMLVAVQVALSNGAGGVPLIGPLLQLTHELLLLLGPTLNRGQQYANAFIAKVCWPPNAMPTRAKGILPVSSSGSHRQAGLLRGSLPTLEGSTSIAEAPLSTHQPTRLRGAGVRATDVESLEGLHPLREPETKIQGLFVKSV
eukprot:scaffold1827_cov421-Prasinococcus_capsulatus_cf.AAC.1